MAQILLIDDDDQFRTMLRTALTNAGHSVLEAENGEIGSLMFAEEPCEMIITDIFMPKKEGIHTVFDFKMEFPDVPVIAISGGGAMSKIDDDGDLSQLVNKSMDSKEILELASDFGADHVVSKPLVIKDLLVSIEQLLNDPA